MEVNPYCRSCPLHMCSVCGKCDGRTDICAHVMAGINLRAADGTEQASLVKLTYERHQRDVPVLSVIRSERSASPLLGGSTCASLMQCSWCSQYTSRMCCQPIEPGEERHHLSLSSRAAVLKELLFSPP